MLEVIESLKLFLENSDVSKVVQILMICEDNNLSILTEVKVRRSWSIVDIGQQACAQLYQFGHELGHVLANSWQPHAQPTNPCQWLEEAMVEAFSLRGLGQMRGEWRLMCTVHNLLKLWRATGAAIAG